MSGRERVQRVKWNRGRDVILSKPHLDAVALPDLPIEMRPDHNGETAPHGTRRSALFGPVTGCSPVHSASSLLRGQSSIADSQSGRKFGVVWETMEELTGLTASAPTARP